MSSSNRVHFEHANPILTVTDMPAAVAYYVGVLGFEEASWGDENFTYVSRDGAGIYLVRGGAARTGSWVWIGVDDVEVLYEELKDTDARIHHEPANYPWALEIRVEDLDGNVLRIGSDSKQDRPHENWRD